MPPLNPLVASPFQINEKYKFKILEAVGKSEYLFRSTGIVTKSSVLSFRSLFDRGYKTPFRPYIAIASLLPQVDVLTFPDSYVGLDATGLPVQADLNSYDQFVDFNDNSGVGDNAAFLTSFFDNEAVPLAISLGAGVNSVVAGFINTDGGDAMHGQSLKNTYYVKIDDGLNLWCMPVVFCYGSYASFSFVNDKPFLFASASLGLLDQGMPGYQNAGGTVRPVLNRLDFPTLSPLLNLGLTVDYTLFEYRSGEAMVVRANLTIDEKSGSTFLNYPCPVALILENQN